MDVMKQFAASGIVPVVVLENAEDAVPTARAMVAGGIVSPYAAMMDVIGSERYEKISA